MNLLHAIQSKVLKAQYLNNKNITRKMRTVINKVFDSKLDWRGILILLVYISHPGIHPKKMETKARNFHHSHSNKCRNGFQAWNMVYFEKTPNDYLKCYILP